MAFEGRLILDLNDTRVEYRGHGEEGIPVLQCTFNFTSPIDPATGHSHGKPQAGLIIIDVESVKNPDFVAWIAYNQVGKGSITFYDVNDQGAKIEDLKLEFEGARLVEYRETFDSTNTRSMTSHLEFNARKIIVNDVITSAEIEYTESDEDDQDY